MLIITRPGMLCCRSKSLQPSNYFKCKNEFILCWPVEGGGGIKEIPIYYVGQFSIFILFSSGYFSLGQQGNSRVASLQKRIRKRRMHYLNYCAPPTNTLYVYTLNPLFFLSLSMRPFFIQAHQRNSEAFPRERENKP